MITISLDSQCFAQVLFNAQIENSQCVNFLLLLEGWFCLHGYICYIHDIRVNLGKNHGYVI